MVELLLRYVPSKASLTAGSEPKEQVIGSSGNFFFRPDAIGPAGLTLFHIAARRDGSEDLVDVLTNVLDWLVLKPGKPFTTALVRHLRITHVLEAIILTYM